jgi:hypothetical protein
MGRVDCYITYQVTSFFVMKERKKERKKERRKEKNSPLYSISQSSLQITVLFF